MKWHLPHWMCTKFGIKKCCVTLPSTTKCTTVQCDTNLSVHFGSLNFYNPGVQIRCCLQESKCNRHWDILCTIQGEKLILIPVCYENRGENREWREFAALQPDLCISCSTASFPPPPPPESDPIFPSSLWKSSHFIMCRRHLYLGNILVMFVWTFFFFFEENFLWKCLLGKYFKMSTNRMSTF